MRKRYLVLVAVALIVVAGVGVWLSYRDSGKHYRQPCKEREWQSTDRGRAFQNIECRFWETESGELYYGIALGYDDFEPILPPISYTYTWDVKKGGAIVVNEKRVDYSADGRLFALDPFGEMRELVLTRAQVQVVLMNDGARTWQEVVLPKLYSFAGETIGGKRVGHWICSDKQGRKAYEGDYADGKRDGTWHYYADTGKMRAELNYKNGRRDGKWTYYSADGTVSDVLTWHNDFPVERAARQVGLGGTLVVRPDGTESGSSGT